MKRVKLDEVRVETDWCNNSILIAGENNFLVLYGNESNVKQNHDRGFSFAVSIEGAKKLQEDIRLAIEEYEYLESGLAEISKLK